MARRKHGSSPWVYLSLAGALALVSIEPAAGVPTCLANITCNNGSNCSSALDCVGLPVGANCGTNKVCKENCSNALAACCGCRKDVNTQVTSWDVSFVQGYTLIRWTIDVESFTAGFHVYRGSSSGQIHSRINPQLITASGTSFSVLDDPGTGHFSYILEIVESTGSVAYQTPLRVEVGEPPSASFEETAKRLQATPISNRTCRDSSLTCSDGTSCLGAGACDRLKVGDSCGGNRTCNEICHDLLGACCGCSRPTAFEITSFTTLTDEHKVSLKWVTAEETRRGRFNLYRSTPGGTLYKITDTAIAAKGDERTGAAYEFLDEGQDGSATYLLEATDPDAGKILIAANP